MDSEKLREEIKRLKGLYGHPKNQQEQAQWDALLSELERKFLSLKQEEVKRTIDYVIEKKKTKGIPLFSEFIAAVAALRHVGKIVAPPSCEGCSGTGLASRLFKRTETGELLRACIPCPMCRKFQYETWQTKSGLEPAAEESVIPDYVLRARAMSPKAARAAFEFLETYKFLSRVPEQVVAEIVKRAGEQE